MNSGKQLLPRMPASARISTSRGWRVKGECGLGVSKRVVTYCTWSRASCWDQRLVGADLGGREWYSSCPWSPAGILLPCHFYFLLLYFIFFFYFLVESQGKLRLGIQNSSVSLDLKKKQTLDMVRGSISKVFIFSFVLEHSWLTILCWFHMYSKVIQLYIYMYLFFFKSISYLRYYRILNSVLCTIQ